MSALQMEALSLCFRFLRDGMPRVSLVWKKSLLSPSYLALNSHVSGSCVDTQSRRLVTDATIESYRGVLGEASFLHDRPRSDVLPAGGHD
jgi:hypothetical protein